jgi:hypothetical protein
MNAVLETGVTPMMANVTFAAAAGLAAGLADD